MPKHIDDIKKLATITSDLELSPRIRVEALELIGNIGTHEALLVLLEIAGNDKLTGKERELALKQARRIIKSGK